MARLADAIALEGGSEFSVYATYQVLADMIHGQRGMLSLRGEIPFTRLFAGTGVIAENRIRPPVRTKGPSGALYDQPPKLLVTRCRW